MICNALNFQDDLTDLEIVGRDLFADDTSPPGHALGYSSVFDAPPEPLFDEPSSQTMLMDDQQSTDLSSEPQLPEPVEERSVAYHHSFNHATQMNL